MGSFLRQLSAVLMLSVRALPSRIASTVVAVIGFAIVSGVLIAVLALATGVSSLWRSAGSDDVALVLGKGAFAEINSHLSADALSQLTQAPGIDYSVKDPISPQLLVTTELPRASDKQTVSALVRGFVHPPLEARQGFTLRSGRMFRPGLDEIIVGHKLKGMLTGVAEGRSIIIGRSPFRVVGTFDASSGIHESEIWGNASSIGDAIGTPGQINSAYIKLATPGDLGKLATYISTVPGLDVDAFRESDYLRRQGAQFSKIILIPGAAIIALMAFAAMLAAVNTMQSSIQARLRELATLRAIGFGAIVVTLGSILEAALLGLFGGAVGSLLAVAMFRNARGITSNGTSAMAFTMTVEPAAVLGTVAFAVLVGVAGGIWPAISAAKCRVADALRRI